MSKNNGLMFKEFKEFAVKGNAVDMAVGIIIGAAFGGIVTSLVKDIIMPPIGLALGGIDFSNLYINLSGKTYASLADAQKAGAATINYGLFLNAVIIFVIVSFVMFLIVRAYNHMQKPVPDATETTKPCPYCATSIPIAAKRCPNCTSDLAA